MRSLRSFVFAVRRRLVVWKARRALKKYRAKICHVTLTPEGYEFVVRQKGASAVFFRILLRVWDFFEVLASYSPVRTKLILYPLVLVLGLGVPVFRYYTVTPGYNACVLEYVETLEEGEYGGYLYDIEGYGRHIEAEGSYMNDALEDRRIGRSYGCIMASNHLYADLSNTIYCSVTYLLDKTPFRNKTFEKAYEKTKVERPDPWNTD